MKMNQGLEMNFHNNLRETGSGSFSSKASEETSVQTTPKGQPGEALKQRRSGLLPPRLTLTSVCSRTMGVRVSPVARPPCQDSVLCTGCQPMLLPPAAGPRMGAKGLQKASPSQRLRELAAALAVALAPAARFRRTQAFPTTASRLRVPTPGSYSHPPFRLQNGRSGIPFGTSLLFHVQF